MPSSESANITESMTREFPWSQSSINSEIMERVLDDYYVNSNKLNVTQIYEKYGLNERSLPQDLGYYLHKEKCPICTGDMRSRFANRAKSLRTTKSLITSQHKLHEIPLAISERVILTHEGYKVTLPKCITCDHVNDGGCQCNECLRVKEYNRQLTIERYQAQYEQEFPERNISDLNAEETLLLVWFRYGEKLGTESQRPTEKHLSTPRDFPSTELLSMSQEEVIEKLQHQGLLKPDPSSIELAIEMSSVTEHIFHKDKLRFVQPFNVLTVDKDLTDHARLLFLNTRTRDDVLRLMGDLCLRECLLFFIQLCHNRGMNPQLSKEFATTIKRAIVDLGLYKTVFAIDWSFQKICKDVVDHGLPKYLAVNKIKSNLSNYWFNGAKEKKYEIGSLCRNETTFRVPRLVSIFVDNFLPVIADYGDPLKDLAAYSFQDAMNTSQPEPVIP